MLFRSGNRVKVKWFGEETNLHSLWDTHLVESENLSYTEFAAFIDIDDEVRIASLQDSEVIDWVEESIVFRDQIYELGDRDYGYDYIYRYVPVVRQRLLQAGVRLAGVLNRLLDPQK